MQYFNFTLTVSGINRKTDGHEDALFLSGCDDAMLSYYGDSLYLEFERNAISLNAAITSAIKDIESAGVGAWVKSVDSNLVGLSEIAELSAQSREAIAMLKYCVSSEAGFPNPIQRISDRPCLWDWGKVALWLQIGGRISAESNLVANANELNNWNIALDLRASKEKSAIAERFRMSSAAAR